MSVLVRSPLTNRLTSSLLQEAQLQIRGSIMV
jgi:hypothetical protein